jgi:branched-subunit amino acid aminotransferase/4-amino-4-deoxychorismate lyase
MSLAVYPFPNGTALFKTDRFMKCLFRSADLLSMEMGYSKDEMRKAVAECIRFSILDTAPKLGTVTSEEQIIPKRLMTIDDFFICHTGLKMLPAKKTENRVLNYLPGALSSGIYRLMADICNSHDE